MQHRVSVQGVVSMSVEAACTREWCPCTGNRSHHSKRCVGTTVKQACLFALSHVAQKSCCAIVHVNDGRVRTSSSIGDDDKISAALSVLQTGQEDSETGQRLDTVQRPMHNKVNSKKRTSTQGVCIMVQGV